MTPRERPSAPHAGKKKGGRLAWRLCALLAAATGLALAAYSWWERRAPSPPQEVFEGVVYGRKVLPGGPEGGGLVHWARVDLTAPGIELYVTPVDPAAVGRGWQYVLDSTSAVAGRERLSVAVNGTLFVSDSGWFRRSGDPARSVETVVAEHRVSHVWEHTYLLWFEDDLTPHLETGKPPPPRALEGARWGVGGQGVWLRDGRVWDGAPRTPDARTAVGIDGRAKALYLAVFEHASPHLALSELAALGARDGMLLDGGDSSTMVLGSGARGVRPGTMVGGWRLAAVHFGVRARARP